MVDNPGVDNSDDDDRCNYYYCCYYVAMMIMIESFGDGYYRDDESVSYGYDDYDNNSHINRSC